MVSPSLLEEATMFSSSDEGEKQDGGTQWVLRVLCGQILSTTALYSRGKRHTNTEEPTMVCMPCQG